MSVKPELKIIADHLRSSSFLIADGIMPSNEGRGYVLRRIMRRAMRQIHKLGVKETAMYKLVDVLIKEMGGAYPELSRAREVIVETLKNEEEKFRETLEKGLKILEEEIPQVKNKIFSGKTAFKLYDTYGFPLDLTQDILKEKNIQVDEKEFGQEMELQRERARKNWVGSGEEVEDKLFFDLKEKFGATEFLGYENLNSKAKILAILEKEKIIILNQTPFYATSGGQKGDDGIIKNKNSEAKIIETKKFAGNLFIHFFENIDASFKVGDEIEAIVNQKTRKTKAQNHSATHLMHKALKEVLGNSISQKGSNVESQYLTFDFNLNRAMSFEEITKVEDLVNSWIQENSSTNTNLMSLEDARNTGAEALFGEKYESKVRVVKMGSSVELCGGTHVKSTGEIGIFKIISEQGIASGIRRINAETGFEVINYYRKKDIEIQELKTKNLQEVKQKNKEIELLKGKLAQEEIKFLKAENNFITHCFKEIDANKLREIAGEIANKNNVLTFVYTQKDQDSSLVAIAIPKNLSEKFNANNLMKEINAKGGGKPDLTTGSIANNDLKKAIEILKNLVSE